MKKEIVPLNVLLFENEKELVDADRILLEQARQAADKAYAPYSRFKVGAAVKLANGKIIHGNNQENAAYPSGLCAERVALFFAHANTRVLLKLLPSQQKAIKALLTCHFRPVAPADR